VQWSGGPVPVQNAHLAPQAAPAGVAPQWAQQRIVMVERTAWQWCKHVIQVKYADMGGRASPNEFWSFQLVSLALMFGLVAPFIALGAFAEGDSTLSNIGLGVGGFFFLALLVGLFLPALSATVRRLHDTGKSGAWILIGIIPIVSAIGGFVLFAFMLTEGTPRANQYGPDPKGRG